MNKAAPVLRLHDSVQQLAKVGPHLASLLLQRHIETIEDLLRFLPRRYVLRSAVQQLSALGHGMLVSVAAEVISKQQRFIRGKRLLEVVVGDETGVLHLVWFRVPSAAFVDKFVAGVQVYATGEIKEFRGRKQMSHPEICFDKPNTSDAPKACIEPIYLDIAGISSKQLRHLIAQALPIAHDVADPIPVALRKRHQLPDLATSIVALHTPPEAPQTHMVHDLCHMATPWQQRLIYEELLLLQLVILKNKHAYTQEAGYAIQDIQHNLAQQLFAFVFTQGQAAAWHSIAGDLQRHKPMQRLLQGDVGSGKTAVALTAAAAVAKAGLQTALLVPTELLAEQHLQTAQQAFARVGIEVALLTGKLPQAARKHILHRLKTGEIQVVVGTHALLQHDVHFKALALGIIDEQHRFGVLQRAHMQALGRASLGVTPHMLVMTATPIPRTLSLTLYGDLDVSIINTLPPGRQPIRTFLVRDKERSRAYQHVRRAIEAGRQAYIVFPLVEESDKESMTHLRDATQSRDELAAGFLQGLRIGLLHGRLSHDEKDQVMRAFAAQQLDVLIATTVIEVGIDVPNATVMVIEHAERFGLSQLHQLRGRVGRGRHASTCVLLAYAHVSDEAWQRLSIMVQTQDGFRIAEEDLAIRGPGDFLGTRQAGMPVLSFANLVRDQQWLIHAKEDAEALLARDPQLRHATHQALAACMQQRLQRDLQLAHIA